MVSSVAFSISCSSIELADPNNGILSITSKQHLIAKTTTLFYLVLLISVKFRVARYGTNKCSTPSAPHYYHYYPYVLLKFTLSLHVCNDAGAVAGIESEISHNALDQWLPVVNGFSLNKQRTSQATSQQQHGRLLLILLL